MSSLTDRTSSSKAIKAGALAEFLDIPIAERCTRDPRCSKKSRHPARCKLDLPDNVIRQRENEILAQNDLERQMLQKQQLEAVQTGGRGFQQCQRNPMCVLFVVRRELCGGWWVGCERTPVCRQAN